MTERHLSLSTNMDFHPSRIAVVKNITQISDGSKRTHAAYKIHSSTSEQLATSQCACDAADERGMSLRTFG
jgi:hypothetical protein